MMTLCIHFDLYYQILRESKQFEAMRGWNTFDVSDLSDRDGSACCNEEERVNPEQKGVDEDEDEVTDVWTD